MKKALPKLLGVLVSTAFTVVLLELAARYYLEHLASDGRFLSYASYTQLEKRYGTGIERDAGLGWLYSPHRYLGFYPTPNYHRGANRHNSFGYRGGEIELPKPAGEFRIACLGGSTTYTSDVEDADKSYPSMLQHALNERGYSNVTVVNAGAASWTSWESLINLEMRVLDLEPDLIIIYHAVNDVHARFVWPPSAYRGDNSGWRSANNAGVFMPGILEYSTLARILMIRAGWISSHADLARTIDRPAPTYYGDLFREQKRRGTYPQGIFEEVSGADMLTANPPRWFERNLGNIAELAERHGVGVVFATFAYSPDFPEEPRVASAEYQGALAEHNEVIKRVASAQGVALFDFAKRFPSDARYFTDGRHVNEQGAALKGELFADFLIAENLVPRPGAGATR